MKNTFVLEFESGFPFPFGATEEKKGINFAVYAKHVAKLSICFFEESNLNQPFKEVELDPHLHKTGDVWHILVKGLPSFVVYAFRISPKEKSDVKFLLLDPYAKAVAGISKWHDENNEKLTYKPLGKVILQKNFQWEEDTPLKIPKKDLVIYEMHARGFTQHASSKVRYPGTFRGIIERIPYFLELGVNTIELMPIHEFNEKEAFQVNPETKKKLHNYFGYSTVNFFSPMNRFSSSSNGDGAVREFKQMVKQLHKNGIQIILDVVFNHTAEGNENGPTLSFKGFDPNGYYMRDKEGHYLNFSGCGNTFNTNHPIVIELIINALRYWVTEMHVDGFRFDLASIFSRSENGTPLENPPVVEAITKDPVLSETLLIAEAWDAGGLYQLGSFAAKDNRWSEWNGKFRDVVRNFIKGSPGQKSAFSGAISGSHDLYGNTGTPNSSINFVTSHDGFSLADLVSYNEKHNLKNGEENRDGINNNESWNCGCEGPSRNKKVNLLRQRQMRNFHLALMISAGVPLLLMGDEYGHTRKGNNNAWCQDNELNWFLWDEIKKNKDFYRFYKFLIHFRKKHPLLGRERFFGENEIKWHGIHPNNPEWENDNRLLALTLNFSSGEPSLYIAFNAGHMDQMIHIPSPGEGKYWVWVVNTHDSFSNDFFEEENIKILEKTNIHLLSYSAIMLKVGNNI